MKFDNLLKLLGEEVVFSSALFEVAGIPRQRMKLQLVRWVQSGKLQKIRRGLYAVNKPYRRIEPHPFRIANQIKKGSYVSLQSALAFYNMIPEYVPVITSVTTGRPEKVKTPLGVFLYRHFKKSLLSGFRNVEVLTGQTTLIATPEKALLDLIYLTPHGDKQGYIEELRLQNLDTLSEEALKKEGEKFMSKKIERALHILIKMINSGVL
jgi:predicted transcriptional regulator of viral defense system